MLYFYFFFRWRIIIIYLIIQTCMLILVTIHTFQLLYHSIIIRYLSYYRSYYLDEHGHCYTYYILAVVISRLFHVFAIVPRGCFAIFKWTHWVESVIVLSNSGILNQVLYSIQRDIFFYFLMHFSIFHI